MTFGLILQISSQCPSNLQRLILSNWVAIICKHLSLTLIY